MGTSTVRRGRVAGFGAIASIAAVAVAGCGAASSSGASATAPPSAAASPGSGSAAGGSTDALGTVRLAAKTSSSATSVAGTMSVQATVKGGSPTASPGTPGAAGSGDLTLSGTFTERIRPSVLASVNIGTLRTAGTTVPGGLSEILTPTTLYLKAPALTKQLHSSKPWLSVSLAKLSQTTGIDLGQLLSSVTDNGPLTQSQLLAGASSVRRAGSTTLDGVPVTEYTGTIDLTKAAAALSSSVKAQLQQAIKAAGLSTATFTVWIDGQHVSRKAVVHEAGRLISETITTTITSLNQPVSIAVPPAAQTAPLPAGTSGSTS